MTKKIGLGIGAALLLAVTGCSFLNKEDVPNQPEPTEQATAQPLENDGE